MPLSVSLRRSLFLCLSLSSSIHSLIGATKGKYACELQEAHKIHLQLTADENHRGWHRTYAFTVILVQSIIFVSLSVSFPLSHTPLSFATQLWLHFISSFHGIMKKVRVFLDLGMMNGRWRAQYGGFKMRQGHKATRLRSFCSFTKTM